MGVVFGIGADLTPLQADTDRARAMVAKLLADVKAMTAQMRVSVATTVAGGGPSPGGGGPAPSAVVAGSPSMAMSAANNLAASSMQSLIYVTRQLTQQFQSMASAMGSGIGGGSGGGGSAASSARSIGGGRGGGMGMMNPFSQRGFARLLGGGAIGYGALAAVHLATEAAETTNITPDRILRGYDQVGSAHRTQDDPYLRQQADASADIKVAQANIKAIEDIPLAGSLLKLVDAITGASAAIEDQAAYVQKSVEIHEQAVAHNDQIAIRQAQISGDPARMVDAQGRLRLAGLQKSALDRPNDPEARRAYTSEVDLFNQESHQAALQRDARLSSISLGTTASNRMRRSYVAQREGDGDRAFDLKQQSERIGEVAGYAAQFRTAKPFEQEAVGRENDAKLKASDERRENERVNRERAAQAAITEANASGAAARLRMSHENDQAEVASFDAATDAKLTRMKQAGEKQSVINSEVKVRIIEREELVTRQHEQLNDRIGTRGEHAYADTLRKGRNNFAADMFEYEHAVARKYNEASAADKPSILAEGIAHEQLMKSEHGRQLANERGELSLRATQADMRAENHGQLADVTGRLYHLQQEVVNASPEVQAATKWAAQKELVAMRHEILGVRGGGIAEDSAMGQIVGDPMDLSGDAKQRKMIAAEFDRAKTELDRTKTADANAAKVPSLLEKIQSILEKIEAKKGGAMLN